MIDKVFIDTNILAYASIEDDFEKFQKTNKLFNKLLYNQIYISTQVLNELYSVFKKNKVDDVVARRYLEKYMTNFNVLSLNLITVKTCLDLRERYQYSYWDCLILSSALLSKCNVVYSEDMQNKQIINSKLKIINPLN